MNRVLRLISWPRLRSGELRPVPAKTGERLSRRRARSAVLAGLVATLLLNLGFALWLDYGPPQVRDPEYGKRLAGLRNRVAEANNRPLVLVIGSSRTSMGIRPEVLSPADPQLFNFSLVGSGPIMELMAFRRALADGVKPDAVLIEYWPAFLQQHGGYAEELRIQRSRLRPIDEPLIREFFNEPDEVLGHMRKRWIAPWFHHRQSLMNQLSASWLPPQSRFEAHWKEMDGWGWLPGRKDMAAPETHRLTEPGVRGFYEPLFAHYEISPVADRALRTLLHEAKALGVPVAIFYLPEASWFEAYVPPATRQRIDAHFQGILQEFQLPLLDTRGWVSDDYLPDGFHLNRDGAAIVTKKLAKAVQQQFPTLSPPVQP